MNKVAVIDLGSISIRMGIFHIENGKLVSLEMMPVVAGFKKEGKLDGLPYFAKGDEGKEIFDVLVRLSEQPYGTNLSLDSDGIIRLK